MITCPVCGSHVELQDLTEPDAQLFVFEEFIEGHMEISHPYPVREYTCLEGHRFFIEPTEGDSL